MFCSYLLYWCWSKWHFLSTPIMYSSWNKEPHNKKFVNSIKHWENMPKIIMSNFNSIKTHISKLWSILLCKWLYPNNLKSQNKNLIVEIVEEEEASPGSVICLDMTIWHLLNRKCLKNRLLKELSKSKMRKI